MHTSTTLPVFWTLHCPNSIDTTHIRAHQLTNSNPTTTRAVLAAAAAAQQSSSSHTGGLVPHVLRASSRVAVTLRAYIEARTSGVSANPEPLAARVALLAVSSAKAELARQGCGRISGDEPSSPLHHTVAKALTLACAQLCGTSSASGFRSRRECAAFFELAWRKVGRQIPSDNGLRGAHLAAAVSP